MSGRKILLPKWISLVLEIVHVSRTRLAFGLEGGVFGQKHVEDALKDVEVLFEVMHFIVKCIDC